MARHRKASRAQDPSPPLPGRFHTPFAAVRAAMRQVVSSSRKQERKDFLLEPSEAQAATDDDCMSFEGAMEGVVPLSQADRGRVDEPAPAGTGVPRPVGEEAEALAVLADLVSGVGPFDITNTEEYIEGRVQGLDPRVVRRLRKGDFSYQTHLDLHHLTAEEAHLEVNRFLSEAYRKGHRCVLIVHGRGRNSKDQIPVLKERLKVWLGRGALARHVLAFTTARACDGGAGALYVLLRRERRRRAPFVVTEGAKR